MLIETLKVFCDAVDLKSFSKAAEANYVTQSSVSQQVKKLEKAWKVTLIERANRDMSLTREGEIVYREAKIILERYEAIHRHLGRTAQTIGGTIRVAAILGVGLQELPPYIKQFIRRYPQVSVRLDYMHNDLVYEEVMNRRADLGVVAFPVRRPGIEVLPFRNDRLVIACHPRHVLAKRSRIALPVIDGMDFIAFEKGIPTGDRTEQFLKGRKASVKIVMRFNNVEMIKGAVEIDAGISILPLVSIQNELEHRTLKAVDIDGKPFVRTLGIIVREGPMPVAPSKFVEILCARRKGTVRK